VPWNFWPGFGKISCRLQQDWEEEAGQAHPSCLPPHRPLVAPIQERQQNAWGLRALQHAAGLAAVPWLPILWRGTSVGCPGPRPDQVRWRLRVPYCESRGNSSFCSCRSVAANERLTAEWHEDNPCPSQVAFCSSMKQKWRCSNAECQHVWEATPNERKCTDCPKCSQKRKRGPKPYVNLAEARPDLVPEWDVVRNACPATGVTYGSNFIAWWVCKKCGGSWQSKVRLRATRGGWGCPRCRELNRLQPKNLLER